MSVLSDRIRTIVAPKGPPTQTSAEVVTRQAPAVSSRSTLEATLGGEWRDGCFVVERRYDAARAHGSERIGAIGERLHAAADHAAMFAAPAGETTTQPPLLFFDLETTGLNGGAGTHAFLIGCAWFDGESFVTRQYVMTRHGDERPILRTLANELARAGTLVSFNGKSFDVPMLETRYSFHRLDWAGSERPHLDVLHPARLFWGPSSARWLQPAPSEGACSLTTLERQLLGKRRAGDVPGFEVPSRYFQFVRTGDGTPLVAVLEHNRLDLLSLAGITARLVHLAKHGPASVRKAREALALGRVYVRAGFESLAREAFARAIELSGAPSGAFDATRIESLRALALAWRRARRFDDAAGCWQALIATRGCPQAVAREASEALAIHHEHRVRDLGAARSFALRSLESIDEDGPAGWSEAVHHRLARIDRKLEQKGNDSLKFEP